MKIKTEVGYILDILDIFSCNGCRNLDGKVSRLIDSASLETDGKNLQLIGIDANKIISSRVIIKNIKPIDFKEEKSICISDMDTFCSILKLFNKNDEIEISSIKDKIRIFRKYPKQSIRISRVNIEDDISPVKSLFDTWKIEKDMAISSSGKKYETIIDTHSHHFKELIEASKLKSPDGDLFEMVFPITILKDKNDWILKMEIGDEQFINLKAEIPCKIKNPKEIDVKFKMGFDVLGKLDGSIKIFVENDMPLIIKKETKELDFTYLIAPLGE